MKKYGRFLIPILLVAMILSISYACAVESILPEDSTEFVIHVQDNSGRAVFNADVYLYCFQTDNIEKSLSSDRNGSCSVTYLPKLSSNEWDVLDQTYRDFLIYVQKDGYLPATYDLTRYYGPDDENQKEFTVTLTPINQVDTQSLDNQILDESAIQAVTSHGRKPFYVVQADSLDNDTRALPDPSYWNENVPIGCFHADRHSKVDVTFTTSDSVTVQSGSKISNIFSISGSRTRKMTSESRYATFAPTAARPQQKVYYSSGYFKKYYTIDERTKLTVEHYVLESINGGTYTGPEKTCTLCGADWDRAWTDQGSCIPVEGNSGLKITDFNNRTFNLGLSIPLSRFGVDGSLGVTSTTSKQTTLTYTPQAGYRLRVYDGNSNKTTWHVTSTNA